MDTSLQVGERRYVGYSELSGMLGISRGTLYSMVARGQIPHFRIGPRLVRFDLVEIADWLQGRYVPVSSGAEQ